MNPLQSILFAACTLLLSSAALAQPAPRSSCPDLPGGSNLHWEQQQRDGYLLCRALDDNQQTAFNLMLTEHEPSIRLARSLRAEQARFADQSIHWYQMDLANDSDELAPYRRISISKLGKQRYAQLWFSASNQAEVDTRIEQIGNLRLDHTLLGNR